MLMRDWARHILAIALFILLFYMLWDLNALDKLPLEKRIVCVLYLNNM